MEIPAVMPNSNTSYSGTAFASSGLSMDDFFSLIAAQLQNQDMLNPVDDTQFIAQMAQMSALQATQELNLSFQTSLAISFAGKNVKAMILGADGKAQEIQGTVDSVSFIDGTPVLTIGENTVSVGSITEVIAEKGESQ